MAGVYVIGINSYSYFVLNLFCYSHGGRLNQIAFNEQLDGRPPNTALKMQNMILKSKLVSYPIALEVWF